MWKTSMEKIQETCAQSLGRVTTDSVHRRFIAGKKQTNKERPNSEGENYFFCKQCKQEIRTVPCAEELKSHFEGIRHIPINSCVYCSKPVYDYKFKRKTEIYHICRYD